MPRDSDSPGNVGERLRILHVSGDFPDPVEPFKTQAIRNLIDLTADRFDHEVVSINRVSPGGAGPLWEAVRARPLRVETEKFEYGIALRYVAPGRGLRHRTKLRQLGDWLADHIRDMPHAPDLIMGHKLAIEGIAVRTAAQACGIPYGLSIQGDSDTKIMDARRDLTGELRAVLHGASVVFPFAPWAWTRVTERLGAPPETPRIMLPCPTDLDQPIKPQSSGNGLLSVFHLKSYRRKNLAGLARAMSLIEAGESEPPKLAVIGGGEPNVRAVCEKIVARSSSITLEGSKDRDDVRATMNSSIAFVLPSLRESFGLVFVEALFAGLPVIYPRGTSVDGYFDGAAFALPVNARDPHSIAAAIRHAVENETRMKEALAEWQQSDDACRFQRTHIGDQFALGLQRAATGQ